MLEKELELARNAAVQAGEILLQSEPLVMSDNGKDIKLNLDTHSEDIILEKLETTGFAILSEERGLIPGRNSDNIWIIDPLDGTANYWRGIREFCCVSIALWQCNKPVLGVVNRFFMHEIYTGIVGQGAWKNDAPIIPSEKSCVTQSVLATGLPLLRDYSEKSLIGFIKDIQRFKKVRMLGSAALMGCFVAEGKIDAYREDNIMLWDIAASSAIVKAAGGQIEITEREKYQCLCQLFANQELREDYYADSV